MRVSIWKNGVVDAGMEIDQTNLNVMLFISYRAQAPNLHTYRPHADSQNETCTKTNAYRLLP